MISLIYILNIFDRDGFWWVTILIFMKLLEQAQNQPALD